MLINVFLTLAIVPLALALLWPLFPVQSTPRWVHFLPAAALVVLFLQILTTGFQGVLAGLYLFSLIVFLATLKRLWQPTSVHARHWFGALLAALFGLLTMAFTLVPAILLPPGYHTAAPDGTYRVGTVTYGWEDPQRLEAYTEDPADHRKIAVQFWYPVDAVPGRQPDGSAVEDAPLALAQTQYPLVIFSHGAFGLRSSNTTSYLELASHGYIVASIDHAYHAFYTSFPDGSRAIISQQFLSDLQNNQSGQLSEAEDLALSFDWLDLRTGDIRFTLDQTEKLADGTIQSPLTGHIDLSKIGLFGHSLGGAAAAAVCREDSRCKAAAVIDSTMFGEYQRDAGDRTLVQAPYPNPLLIIYNGDTYYQTADHEGYVPDVNAFEHAAAPAYSVVVNGAQHLNFTDLPARAPVLAKMLGSMMTVNGGTTGTISQARCMEILDRYLVDFFNQALLDQPSQLLSGASPFPEVDFSAHTIQ